MIILVLFNHGGTTWLGLGSAFLSLVVTALPVTLIAGALSYWLVERPLLRRPRRRRARDHMRQLGESSA